MALTDEQRAERERRSEATRAWLDDPESMAELMQVIASDVGLRTYCREHGLAYSTIYDRIRKDPDLEQLYEAAMQERGDAILEEIQRMERRLAEGEIDPKLGNALLASMRWRAEKSNPRRFGNFQQVETRSYDMTRAHTEALRGLARKGRTIEHEAPRAAIGQEPATTLRATARLTSTPALVGAGDEDGHD